jgi:hypothetical protein
MATSETGDVTVPSLSQANRKSGIEGGDTEQAAPPESIPTGDAPPWTSFTGVRSPLPEQIVRQNGRFTLNRSVDGFHWVLTTNDGSVWFWHPEGRQWTANSRAYGTEEEATAGLDHTLSHASAGDLNDHYAPRESSRPD